MAQSQITLTELVADIDVTPRKARRILRGSTLKHDRRSAWTFTPAQAKAAKKVLAA